MPTPTAIDPISASLRLIIERMHKHVGDRLYDLRSEAEAILPITCIEATTPAKPGADGKKSLAQAARILASKIDANLGRTGLVIDLANVAAEASALLSKLAAHLDPAQARIALAALDAEQAPARQAARDLFNRTLADLDAERAPLLASIHERACENEANRDQMESIVDRGQDRLDALLGPAVKGPRF